MPLCTLETNIARNLIPDDFHIQLSDIIATVLKKPAEKISVSIHPGLQMCRGGSNEPTCTLVIWSIGVFSAEKNPQYFVPFHDFISAKLGIPKKRVVLAFHDLKPEELGVSQ